MLNTGAKIWLWILLALDIIGCVVAALGAFGVLVLTGLGSFLWTIISIVVTMISAVGVAMLLFGGKKAGFYITCVCAASGLVLQMMSGIGLMRAAAATVLHPFITYLLIRNQWNELE